MALCPRSRPARRRGPGVGAAGHHRLLDNGRLQQPGDDVPRSRGGLDCPLHPGRDDHGNGQSPTRPRSSTSCSGRSPRRCSSTEWLSSMPGPGSSPSSTFASIFSEFVVSKPCGHQRRSRLGHRRARVQDLGRPFHTWAPDVYQGAPAGIVGYMAAVAKIAGFVAISRVLLVALADLDLTWLPVVAGVATLVDGRRLDPGPGPGRRAADAGLLRCRPCRVHPDRGRRRCHRRSPVLPGDLLDPTRGRLRRGRCREWFQRCQIVVRRLPRPGPTQPGAGCVLCRPLARHGRDCRSPRVLSPSSVCFPMPGPTSTNGWWWWRCWPR